ncbi:hypothetical protein HAX54_029383 [Datura stramonium]|uniref:Uncharacterized protein n=1 Tax=Datura stramonium TaxID=4076 RepID=A0ABS8SA79_DATST|nr:hypothetical protein [Datura stramonium]
MELVHKQLKVGTAKHYGAQAVEPHGLTWFNTKKEANYATRNWIDEGYLALEFPAIQDKPRELVVGYIFAKPGEWNLTLVKEFYSNWDTSFRESTKVKIRGQMGMGPQRHSLHTCVLLHQKGGKSLGEDRLCYVSPSDSHDINH